MSFVESGRSEIVMNKIKQSARCSCGRGMVVRLAYTEDDDGGRFQSGILSLCWIALSNIIVSMNGR